MAIFIKNESRRIPLTIRGEQTKPDFKFRRVYWIESSIVVSSKAPSPPRGYYGNIFSSPPPPFPPSHPCENLLFNGAASAPSLIVLPNVQTYFHSWNRSVPIGPATTFPNFFFFFSLPPLTPSISSFFLSSTSFRHSSYYCDVSSSISTEQKIILASFRYWFPWSFLLVIHGRNICNNY